MLKTTLSRKIFAVVNVRTIVTHNFGNSAPTTKLRQDFSIVRVVGVIE
jgi:hypothetical protein